MLRMSLTALLGLSLLSAGVSAGPGKPIVQTGIDMLAADGFKLLAGKRVGLITNPTGVTYDLRSTADLLHEAAAVELVALYGPEHGVRGDAHAGDHVQDTLDTKTGVPMHSLYGKNRKPTPEMFSHIDVLVFDIQDIGSRSYTFISTMAVAMEAAAQNGKPFVVLDRPNPLNGVRMEGRPLDLKYKSFVGYLPIPYVHGMTVGELAQMINGEGWLKDGIKCDLTVVPMKGWKRRMSYDATGLTWVSPSPHVPRAASSMYYAATGIMGELRVFSEGVGYPLPFELVGAPTLQADALAKELNARHLTGVHFRPIHFKPYYASHKGETCGGVQIHLLDPQRVHLTAIQFHVMDVAQSKFGIEMFGKKRSRMFDKVCGTDRIRTMFADGTEIKEILRFWDEGLDEFRVQRKPYLLYD